MDVKNNDRPERRTALVCRELARFNVDVAALSETRLAEEGSIKESGSNYTIFWKGKKTDERRIHGVGFAVKTKLVEQYTLTPTTINERLITLRIPLRHGNHLTIISVYAPTLDSEDFIKDSFYDSLHSTIQNIPKSDKLVIMGDFNARVGRDHQTWKGILGPHGIGNCNSNGMSLLGLCAEHGLTVTNSLFRLPNRHKTTWQHPRSKHWHTLDYVLVRARDRKEVHVTRSMPGADDCWTDHRLLISRLSIELSRPTKHRLSNKPKPRFECSKLRNQDTSELFRISVQKHLNSVPVAEAINEDWTTLRSAVLSAAEEVLGFRKRKNPDWFEEHQDEIDHLINQKREARLSYENHPSNNAKELLRERTKVCQRKIREIQNTWWQTKATEIQQYADHRDMRRFYASIKEIYGPVKSSVGGLKDAGNNITLTDPKSILDRWRLHFENLLNDHAVTQENLLQNTPQLPPRPWMSLPPTPKELQDAISRMNAGKAPGPDNIPFELLAHGGSELKNRLMLLIHKIWETKLVPDDFRNANIITIFKKGDRTLCDNYRGISLLSVAGKIFARILLNRLLVVAEEVLPESQCGFRPSRGTIDMIFCARQLQEKGREQRKPVMFIFWDLQKAFDKVPRPAMWATLSRFGCPEHFVSLIRSLHDGMEGRVCYQGSLSDPFPITGGLKQGCVLAPTLFSLYLAAMLNEIPPEAPGVDLRSRFDGGVFNLARLRSAKKTTACRVRELQYADDNATINQSIADLQQTANYYSEAYQRFGMQVNVNKTKILIQPTPGEAAPDITITIDGKPLEVVEHFPYLGSILSNDASCVKDLENRLNAAHTAYGRLSHRVFNNHSLSIKTKVMVFRAVVLSTLLYGCETWTLYRRDIKLLERFQQTKLRRMLRVNWEDHITNLDVLTRVSLPSVEATILHHRLRWAGHVSRMGPTRLPRTIFYGQLAEGTRPRGAPKRRYKDQLKRTLIQTHINPGSWEESATNRPVWRRTVREGVDVFETNRRQQEEQKREARKLRQSQPRPPPTIPCGLCPRLFRSRLGLYSHVTHKH